MGTHNMAFQRVAAAETPNPDASHQVMLAVLRCADIAHPCKSRAVHLRWSKSISREFFAQGDKEIAEGYPISPLCSRDGAKDFPKQQKGFIDFVVEPTLRPFADWVGGSSSKWLSNLG